MEKRRATLAVGFRWMLQKDLCSFFFCLLSRKLATLQNAVFSSALKYFAGDKCETTAVFVNKPPNVFAMKEPTLHEYIFFGKN